MYSCLEQDSDKTLNCSLLVHFHDNNCMDTTQFKVDISKDNVVVIATKAEGSGGMWEEFEVGINNTCMQVRGREGGREGDKVSLVLGWVSLLLLL